MKANGEDSGNLIRSSQAELARRHKPNRAKARSAGCLGTSLAFAAMIVWLLALLGTVDTVPQGPAGPMGGRLQLVVFITWMVGLIGSLLVADASTWWVGAALLFVAGVTALLSGVLLFIDGSYVYVAVLAVTAGLVLLSAVLLALRRHKQGPPQV